MLLNQGIKAIFRDIRTGHGFAMGFESAFDDESARKPHIEPRLIIFYSDANFGGRTGNNVNDSTVCDRNTGEAYR